MTELFRFGHPNRRLPENRLRRIAVEIEIEEEKKIDRWLELGAAVLADQPEVGLRLLVYTVKKMPAS
jgi:hypothetical protein